MSLDERIQEQAKMKYRQKLEKELAKPNPNQIQLIFLRKVIKRIEEGKVLK